jgi:DNA (cytosine-5)-methyltransferase 1
MEQVPGLLSSHTGEDFREVLRAFLECGARDVGWRVLDSQWFGVAQRRERCFVAVDFGGERCAEILALSESLRGDSPPIREEGQEVAATFTRGSFVSGNPPGRRREDDVNLVPIELPQVAGTFGGAGKRGWPTSVDVCTFIPVAFAENQRGEVRVSEVSPQFCVGGGKPGQGYSAVLDQIGVRRMTPRERERGQGWPDDWTRYGRKEDGTVYELKDGPRYAMTGNGVTATVSKWIGENVIRCLR